MPTYLAPGVFVEEAPSSGGPIEGVATSVAAFIGIAERGPFHEPTLVTNWSQFTRTFGDFVEGAYLAHAVYGYMQNGGGSCYVLRIGDTGAAPAPVAAGELTAGSGAARVPSFKVSALEAGPAGNDVSVEIADPGEGGAADTFSVVVKKGGVPTETFEGLTTKRGKTNVAEVVNAQSALIRIEQIATGAVDRPAAGSLALTGGGAPATAPLTPDDYVGDVAARSGFGALEAIEDATMVACPDLMAAYQSGALDLDGVKAVQIALIAHCELMGDRMAILDTPPGMSAQQVRDWRLNDAGYDSKQAALYWPWIKVFDPPTGALKAIPPSGYMAGVWAKTDATRGVHKAPANEVIAGAVGVEITVTSREQEILNPNGINAIRSFPGRGIRVWGARTLSSDATWRYVNVRRLFNYLEKSILLGTQWCVFEPNDPFLWGRIDRTISAFLSLQWRSGALFGATAGESFYVKCDAETNPPEAVEAGQVLCEIGVAPVKPAEFIIFRLSQWAGGGGADEGGDDGGGE